VDVTLYDCGPTSNGVKPSSAGTAVITNTKQSKPSWVYIPILEPQWRASARDGGSSNLFSDLRRATRTFPTIPVFCGLLGCIPSSTSMSSSSSSEENVTVNKEYRHHAHIRGWACDYVRPGTCVGALGL
jgi:hypothetical protein